MVHQVEYLACTCMGDLGSIPGILIWSSKPSQKLSLPEYCWAWFLHKQKQKHKKGRTKSIQETKTSVLALGLGVSREPQTQCVCSLFSPVLSHHSVTFMVASRLCSSHQAAVMRWEVRGLLACETNMGLRASLPFLSPCAPEGVWGPPSSGAA